MTRVRLTGIFVLLLTAFASAALPAEPLRVHLALPSNVVDAPRLAAELTVENTSSSVLDVPGIDSASVHFLVTQVQDHGTGKCVLHAAGTPLTVSPRITLLPGQAARARTNVFIEYPLGLAPGRYLVQAIYDVPPTGSDRWHGSVKSEQLPLQVDAPKTADYAEFLNICGDLRGVRQGGERRIATAPDVYERALAFAYANPRFEFTPLLVDLELPDSGDIGARAAEFLIREYPGTEYAIHAKARRSFQMQVEADRLEYERYQAWIQSEKSKPENATVNRDAARLLVSIDRPEGFAKTQRFLDLHPHSYLGAEARWSRIEAVERGIIPPGMTREAARIQFYRDLIAHDPQSLWAKRAMRNPEVAAMVDQKTPQ